MSSYAEVRSKLLELLKPHQGTPLFQRVNQYILDKTGVKIPQYLGDGSIAEADKVTVLSELITILKAGDYAKLPTAASGQAQAPGGAPAPAPKPAPKPEVKKPEAPAPEPTAPTEPEPVIEDEDPEVAAAEAEAKRLAAEAAAALARAKAAAAAKLKPAGLNEEQVRAIVREEIQKAQPDFDAIIDARLKVILTTLAAGLKGGE